MPNPIALRLVPALHLVPPPYAVVCVCERVAPGPDLSKRRDVSRPL